MTEVHMAYPQSSPRKLKLDEEAGPTPASSPRRSSERTLRKRGRHHPRRRACIQYIQRSVPRPLIILFVVALSPILVAAHFSLFPLVFFGPGLLSLLVGNAVHTKLNLPRFPAPSTSLTIYDAGGKLGLLVSIPVGFLTMFICVFTEMYCRKRYHHVWNRHIERHADGNDHDEVEEEGKPLARARPDSHFPIILLWIPCVFFDAYMSVYFGSRDVSHLVPSALSQPVSGPIPPLPLPLPPYQLTQKDILQMVTIGGVVVSPLLTILIPVVFGVVLPACVAFFQDVLSSTDGMQDESLSEEEEEKRRKEEEKSAHAWLYRQYEAFCWLVNCCSVRHGHSERRGYTLLEARSY